MCISTDTPTAALLEVVNANVDTTSTIVAVKPPCKLPIELACSSDTVSSAVHFPFSAATMLIYNIQYFLTFDDIFFNKKTIIEN